MLSNQVRLSDCSKPNGGGAPRFAAEKGFIHKAGKQGGGRRTNLKFACSKARDSGCVWDKEAGWSGA